MDSGAARYFAYMLRLWRGVSAGEIGWHASLEDPQTGERRGFGSLTELFEYLLDKTKPPETRGPGPDPDDKAAPG